MTALADTSCLLRLPFESDARHVVTLTAIDMLNERGETVVIVQQNCTEFRNAASRPAAVNGLGMTPQEADAELDIIELLFPMLPDPTGIYAIWRDLCRRAGVSGKQVHDTRLVAVCVAAGVGTILTWNPRDFVRFLPFVPGLTVLTPDDVLNAP